MAVAVAERLLGRPIHTVLDVGCGEGAWRAALGSLRPGARYLGLDPSDYAVGRFGRRRGIRAGSFGDLAALRFGRRFDLVVCADVLHYLPAREIDRGLEGLVAILGGVAYLEVLAREDDPTGDMRGFVRRPAPWYRDRFLRAGLIACGMHCYAAPGLRDAAAALEVAGG